MEIKKGSKLILFLFLLNVNRILQSLLVYRSLRPCQMAFLWLLVVLLVKSPLTSWVYGSYVWRQIHRIILPNLCVTINESIYHQRLRQSSFIGAQKQPIQCKQYGKFCIFRNFRIERRQKANNSMNSSLRKEKREEHVSEAIQNQTSSNSITWRQPEIPPHCH